uniref:F-box associated domain-containing protein n=1 Tax=Lotus japonicus TaxID=34305 RepID=I3T0F6_LOTJA|nr:unknown [Lotus japonicus]
MEKRILEIPHPDPVDLARRLSSCNLWVYGRFLSLSVKRRDKFEIFVMDNYKAQSSWTKTIVLSLSGICPVCSTKGGDIVMDGFTKLVKYTDNGEQLEHCEYRGYLESRVPIYIESMLSLPSVDEQS